MKDTLPKRYVMNLALIWLLGVLGCGWIIYYTDWFPVIGGLLGLGGVFSWLAFVSNILKEERVESLRDLADRYLFQSRVTTVVLIGLMVTGLLVACFRATIEVKAVGAGTDRIVFFGKEEKRLAPGAGIRWLVGTSWFSPRKRTVRVAGFPKTKITTKPFQRKTLIVPTSFLREVVLLRPTPELAGQLRNNPSTLEVRVEGWEKTIRSSYRGEAVWIGCGDEVDVPTRLQEQWRVKASGHALMAWLQPASLPDADLELRPKQKITVRILFDGDAVYMETSFYVKRMNRPGDFPQVEDLDVPR